ncbi:transposase [Sulfitobacter sp. BDSS02]|nr:transposase [Sulfitobacter sp. BDSS02]
MRQITGLNIPPKHHGQFARQRHQHHSPHALTLSAGALPTRKVLAWRISNTLEADFCVEALNEAIHKFGPPEIMNTDQGSQFTSFAWIDRLKRIGARISMDGKGRCLDNIFIERLWRSLKYECVYLHAWETGSQAKDGIGRWITFYNHRRPHTAHGGQPPAVVYFNQIETDQQGQRVA